VRVGLGIRFPRRLGRDSSPGRPASAGADQVRTGDQPQDRQGAWLDRIAHATRTRRQDDRVVVPFATVHESAIGPKQTWARALHMSAFDPKRTLSNGPSHTSLSSYDAVS
jgi:hypothetical protein